METVIMAEFRLSMQQYNDLLLALHSRLGIKTVEDVAFLSPEQLYSGMDRWESAALKRIFEIVTAQIGVEKMHQSGNTLQNVQSTPAKRQRDTSPKVHFAPSN
jgi:hypothetical protein